MQNTPIRRLSAFTLLELLVTIAILAVLSALFLASIGKIKERADVTRSIASLRSVVVASIQFANDHQGVFGLYGIPARQTMGMTAEATAAPPRALFPSNSPLGRHPAGGGDYLEDTLAFHNPRVKKLRPPGNPKDEFGRSENGRQEIGYYYYSLPSGPDELGRPPYEMKGQIISNHRLLSAWGRTPLYSDLPIQSLAESNGLEGDSLVVAHVDGSSSIRSIKKSTEQPTWAWRIYYMATGVGSSDQ